MQAEACAPRGAVTKALLILFAIVLGAGFPQLAGGLPALPWIIGVLLLISFCALALGALLTGAAPTATAAP